MAPLSEELNIDSSKEKFMKVFKHELEMFQKPKCDPSNLGVHSTEDILHDIFFALYGNGGATRGIIWKLAEQSVFVLEVTNKQNACRGQIVAHFKEHERDDIAKDRGVIAFARRHRTLSVVAIVLMFFGISSLWSIALQKKQANNLERVVLTIVNKHIPITSPATKTPGG